MTPRQRIELRMSQRRQRIGELLAVDELADEQRTELDTLTKGLGTDETELRAATLIETADSQAAQAEAEAAGDTKTDPAKVELRAACRLGNFFLPALAGVPLSGAEAEYAAETGLTLGKIPLDMFEPEKRAERPPVETRAISPAPSTVGVNLDPILPAIFARSVLSRLGVDMPRVESGTYATGTVTTSVTADVHSIDEAAAATAAAITVQTTEPHRVSARMSIALESIAAIGTDNFQSILRQNTMLVQSAKLDEVGLTGDSASDANSPDGLLKALTDPTGSPSAVATWLDFVSAISDGIDAGPWAESMTDVRLCANAETMRLAETTFRVPVGDDTKGVATPGEMSAAAYLRAHSGGFFSSARMPATASNVAQAIRYRPGTVGLDGVDAMRTAVCPVWAEVGIDDIYTDSAKGHRHFTLHALIGDVIVTQSSAYEQIQLQVSS